MQNESPVNSVMQISLRFFSTHGKLKIDNNGSLIFYAKWDSYDTILKTFFNQFQ